MKTVLLCLLIVLLTVTAAFAQQAPAAPMKTYTGSFGGGFALTSGNTDTKNFNLTFDMVRDPKTRNVIKANASYLRGTQSDILSVDRTAFNVRDEYSLTTRVYAFGQLDYLRDQFKQIIFLWAPSGGLGYKLINTDPTKLTVDGGAGGFFEKNPGREVTRSGAVTAGERFTHKLSASSTFNQNLGTIWKTDDFGDYLTNFSVGLTSSIMQNLDIKVEFLDSYKRKPQNIGVKRNDTAFITAFVLKF
jgi:putative salt-induced outer membrane protein